MHLFHLDEGLWIALYRVAIISPTCDSPLQSFKKKYSLHPILCGGVWLGMKFKKERKTLKFVCPKEATDICEVINHLIKGKIRNLKFNCF